MNPEVLQLKKGDLLHVTGPDWLPLDFRAVVTQATRGFKDNANQRFEDTQTIIRVAEYHGRHRMLIWQNKKTGRWFLDKPLAELSVTKEGKL